MINHQLKVLEKFDLLRLTAQQQQVARGMILKEVDMKTQLKDQVPVKKSYNRIPKPLHKKIKEYVEDLLNRGWIVPSESNSLHQS